MKMINARLLAVLSIVPATTGAANAGIVHTVVNETIGLSPGVTEVVGSFDLTRDGSDDFGIAIGIYPDPNGEPTSGALFFFSLGANIQVSGGLSLSSIVYQEGDAILPASTQPYLLNPILYAGFGPIFTDGDINNGMGSASDLIYALNIMIDGHEHFGWLRLDYAGPWSHASVTVRDFAFDTSPNTPVFAGQIPSPGSAVLLSFAAFAAARRQRAHAE